MRSIDELCEEFRQTYKGDLVKALTEYSARMSNSFIKNSDGDMVDIAQSIGILSCCALAVDGKIEGKEFDYLYNSLRIALGEKIDLSSCRAIANELIADSEELKDSAYLVAENYLSQWSDADKESAILFCIALCAVDGKISGDEKEWLEDLAFSAEV